MKMAYSVPDLGYTFLKLSFDEWRDIPESAFYHLVTEHEENLWLLRHGADLLPDYIGQVNLLRVGEAFYKLDGKLKEQAWLNGKATPPTMVVAQVFVLQKPLFMALTQKAIKRISRSTPPHDTVKLIYQELGLAFCSERLKGGFINEAVNIALRGTHRVLQIKKSDQEMEEIDMHKAIGLFRGELLQIDRLNPDPDIFVTGILAGALIMLGLNKKIDDFLTRLNEQNGETKGDAFDPVTLTLRAIGKYKAASHANKRRFSIYLSQIFVQASTSWVEGRDSPVFWRKRMSSGAELLPYIHALKQLKGIIGDRAL